MLMIKKTILSLLCISLGIQVFAQPSPALSAHLQTFRNDYSRGLLAGDLSKMAAYYADDIRLLPEFQKTLIGKDQAEAYYRAFAERFALDDYQRTSNEVIDLGGQVIEIGRFEMQIARDGLESTPPISGKYMDIWIKPVGKQWQLVSQAWNYNRSLDIEDQFRFPSLPHVDVAIQAHLPIDNAIRFELAALNRLMEVTITQEDGALWSRFYADDGQFLYSRHDPVTGRHELNDFFAQHVLELPIFEHLDVRTDRIDDLGTYVIEYSSHIANVRNGSFSGVFTGKDLRIWRREANCSLKIFRHIAMYD